MIYLEKSDLGEYIDNEFLESSLNEKYRQTFYEACNSTSLDDMANIIAESVEYPDFIQEELGEIISGRSNRAVLEYSGDPEKNEEFKEILKDLDKQLSWFMAEAVYFEKQLSRLSKEIQDSVKDPKKFQATLKDHTQTIVKINKWMKDNEKNLSSTIWKRFDKAARSINNKYGTVSIEEKKKVDKKFAQYQDKIVAIVKPWGNDGAKSNATVKALEDIEGIDYDISQLINKKFSNIYTVFFDDSAATYNDIVYARKALALEKEGTLFYKLVQKFKKDK